MRALLGWRWVKSTRKPRWDKAPSVIPRKMFCNSLLTEHQTVDAEGVYSCFFNMKHQKQSEWGEYPWVALKARASQNQYILELSKHIVPTLTFNVIYHSWFSNFSVTFSSSASSILKNVLFFLQYTHFSENSTWTLSPSFLSSVPWASSQLLLCSCMCGLQLHFLVHKTLQGIGGPEVSDVLSQANRWGRHQEK